MFTMKMSLLIACSIICSVTAQPPLNDSTKFLTKIVKLRDDIYTWIQKHPDVNNSTIRANTIKLSNETTEEIEKKLPNRVIFLLYTRNNLEEPQQLFIDDIVTLNNSNFDMQKQTKFVTHGWRADHTHPTCVLVREAFLQHSACNVIVIDWGKMAMTDYYFTLDHIVMVGKFAAKMVSFLELQGMDENKVTLVGHSGGANIVSLASYYAIRKPAYLFGLDPAPNIVIEPPPNALFSRDHAKFVEVIHSNSGVVALGTNLGDADFWPDGGVIQAGCDVEDLVCSHFRAFLYFAESINSNVGFVGVQCPNYTYFMENKCANNPRGIMGGAEPQPGLNGTYYLKTNDKPPYAKGYQ